MQVVLGDPRVAKRPRRRFVFFLAFEMGNINGKNHGLSINYGWNQCLSHSFELLHSKSSGKYWKKVYGLLMFIYDLMGKDGEFSMVKGFEMG